MARIKVQQPARPEPNPMWRRSEAKVKGGVMVVDSMLLDDIADHYRIFGVKPAAPNPRTGGRR